jgi:hypothetical protein
MRVAAFAALEGHRDDLAAFGVIAEARRIRHADEFEFDQRLLDLQRLGDQFAQFLQIGSVSNDKIFAIDETVRPHRIGRIGERHGKSPRPHITFFHGNFLVPVKRNTPSQRCSSPQSNVRTPSSRSGS